MAPKKKRVRKGKTIPEHDRRNLELMYQSYFRLAMIFANVAFMAIIVGAVASFQVSKTIGYIVLLAGVAFAFVMFIFAIYSLRRAGRIAKELGTEETTEKYDV